MGDMGDHFRDLKEASKLDRDAYRTSAPAAIAKLVRVVNGLYSVRVCEEGRHYQLCALECPQSGPGDIASWWPETGRWAMRGMNGAGSRRGVNSLLAAVTARTPWVMHAHDLAVAGTVQLLLPIRTGG